MRRVDGGPGWSARPGAAALLVGGIALAISGCGSGEPQAEAAIERFLGAVADQRIDELFCLMAGASSSAELGDDPTSRRAGFEQWSLARFVEYEQGRDRGRVELDGSGIVLARLFGLGRGTFYSLEAARPIGPDGLQLDSRLSFGYGSIDLSRFTPGTTFYVAGSPPGRVHAVRVPAGGRQIAVDALDSLWIRWSLVRDAGDASCTPGWRVAGVEPIEGTARTTEVTWIF